ncbi:MAG: hypothetical protein ACT4QG_16680 [Sporichthyaceae bacterium]
MGHATGLGPLDTALLLAAYGETWDSGRRVKSSRVLAALHDDTGEDPHDGYRALVSLTQPWLTTLPLFEGAGNFGSPGNDPAADPQYTLCRLSAAGSAAAAAERGYGPPIPFGLVNGSMFRGGKRPPFDPRRVADAMSLVAQGRDPWHGVLALGLPSFPGGATPTVAPESEEMHNLRKGWHARLTFEPVVRDPSPGQPGRVPGLEIVALPPYSNWDEVAFAIVDASHRLGADSPLHGFDDLTNSRQGLLMVCRPCKGASFDELREFLHDVPVGAKLTAQLSAPATDLLTAWVQRHGREATLAGAEALRALAAEST